MGIQETFAAIQTERIQREYAAIEPPRPKSQRIEDLKASHRRSLDFFEWRLRELEAAAEFLAAHPRLKPEHLRLSNAQWAMASREHGAPPIPRWQRDNALELLKIGSIDEARARFHAWVRDREQAMREDIARIEAEPDDAAAEAAYQDWKQRASVAFDDAENGREPWTRDDDAALGRMVFGH